MHNDRLAALLVLLAALAFPSVALAEVGAADAGADEGIPADEAPEGDAPEEGQPDGDPPEEPGGEPATEASEATAEEPAASTVTGVSPAEETPAEETPAEETPAEPSDEDDADAPAAKPSPGKGRTGQAAKPAASSDGGSLKGKPGDGRNWPSLPDTDADGRPTSTKYARPKFTDFIRTTLSFYAGDDNLLAGAEAQSENFGISTDYPELFFEGLNAEKPQVVTESHLVLYGKMPGFLPFVDTEAAFVAEFELSRDPEDGRLISSFRDDGSYIAATFWFNKAKRGNNIKLTAWPYSADRFRLGYLFDLTWGGDRLWINNTNPVPGIKVNLDLQRFYAFIGGKSLARPNAALAQMEQYWAVLGGLGPNVWLGPEQRMNLRYDVGGGYFNLGTFESNPFKATPVQMFGISQRVMLTHNNPRMGYTADLRLFRNDPDYRRQSSNVPLYYYGDFGFGVSAEFSTVWSGLIDADAPDALRLQNSLAGAISGQVRFLRNMRVGIDAVYRGAEFLVLTVPGDPPFTSFFSEAGRQPQIYGALWWDYYVAKAKLTPGFTFGVMQPAAFFSSRDAAGDRQVKVVLGPSDYQLLPPTSDIDGDHANSDDVITKPFTVISAKASLRWSLSHMLAIIGEVSFEQNFNQTRIIADPSEVGQRESKALDYRKARALGLNLIMQAQF